MTPELQWIQNNIGLITWPVAFVIGIIWIGKPLVNWFINRKDGNGSNLSKRFDLLEKKANHEHSAWIQRLESRIDSIDNKMDTLSDRVAHLEGRMNGNYK